MTKCYHDNVTADICQENLKFVKTDDLMRLGRKTLRIKHKMGERTKGSTLPVKL